MEIPPYIDRQREWHEENLDGHIARHKNFSTPTRNEKSKNDFFYLLCKDHEKVLTLTRPLSRKAFGRLVIRNSLGEDCTINGQPVNAYQDLFQWFDGERLLRGRFWYYLEIGEYIGNIRFPEKHSIIEGLFGYHCTINFTSKILEHIYRRKNTGECVIEAFKKFYYDSFEESVLETPE